MTSYFAELVLFKIGILHLNIPLKMSTLTPDIETDSVSCKDVSELFKFFKSQSGKPARNA